MGATYDGRGGDPGEGAVKTIWKYPLGLARTVHLLMPLGAEVLTVQLQGGVPTLWAIVESDATMGGRMFIVNGTGNEFHGDEGRYIGTWQQDGYVWHLFEEA